MNEQLWHRQQEEKSTWGPGPWQAEPDKIQWRDETSGLPCLIVRGPVGNLCGYAGVYPGHPLYGFGYAQCPIRCPASLHDQEEREERWAELEAGTGIPIPPEYKERLRQMVHCEHTPEAVLRVHGGITFADACMEGEDPGQGICHVPEPGEGPVWWFGFDCGHCHDVSPGLEATTRLCKAAMRRAGALPVWTEPETPPLSALKNPDGTPYATYKEVGYLQEEVATLVEQLAEIRDRGMPTGEEIQARIRGMNDLTFVEMVGMVFGAAAENDVAAPVSTGALRELSGVWD